MPRRRLQSWLQETHGTQFELVRHFLSQNLSSSLMSSEQARRIAIAALALVACLGPVIVRLYVSKYAFLEGLPTGTLYLQAVRADRLFFITFSMVVAGIVTGFQWQSLFPGREDYLTLKPLPLSLYHVLAARFLSSFVLIGIVVADLNLATSVLFPWLTSGKWQSPGFGIRYIFAHAVVTVGAGLFVFLAMAAIQGVYLNLLSSRAFERISVLLQALFVVTWFTTVPYVFDIPNWHLTVAARPNWMDWFPPSWFEGLYETMLGTQDLYFHHQANTAALVLSATALISLLAYFVSYKRHATRVLETSPLASGISSQRFWEPLHRRLVSNPREHAVFDFVLCTLRRSRQHRLLITFSVGIALVLALQPVGPILLSHWLLRTPLSDSEVRSTLAMPIVIGSVVISALFHVFQLPSEIRANWLFRLIEETGRRELLDAAERILLLFGIVPALLTTFPVEVLVAGMPVAFAHALFSATFLLLLMEVRLREWHKVPFTCSYLGGRRNLWQTLGAYL